MMRSEDDVQRFLDRRSAGRELALRLVAAGVDGRTLVLGLPRGGVPVAAEVAATLDADLDVLVVRKLGAPEAPEVALGALGEGGVEVMDERMLAIAGGTRADMAATIERERAEVERRVRIYRRGRGPRDLRGREVVLVDDGIATGSSAQAAIEVVRTHGVSRVVLAVPVAGPAAVARLEPLVDSLVALLVPPHFRAVGEWYEDFRQTSDGEVTAALDAADGLGD